MSSLIRKIDYVMITPSYPPHIGGVERFVNKLHLALQKRGLTGKILVVHEGQPPEKTVDDAIWIDFSKGLTKRRVFLQLKSTRTLLRLLRNSAASVLQFHDFVTYYPFLPFLRYFGFLSKSYITFHGWEGRFPPHQSVVRQRQICSRTASGSIAIGNFIHKWYGGKIDVVVHGGVDVDHFTTRSHLKELPLRAAYIGRFERDTGLPLIVDAFRRLQGGQQMIPLTLFGAGEFEWTLRDSIGTIRSVDVRPPPNNIKAVYEEYPLIFASGYLTILEALCARRIVFTCYENPLRKDYLTLHPAASSLFICGSIDEILQALFKCRDNLLEVKQRLLPGWKWAREQSWDRIADVYLKLWKIPIPKPFEE